MIPKRLIVTYISRSLLDAKLSHCISQMERLHPDWKIEFFSDGDCEQLVGSLGSSWLDLYRWYPRNVQRADLFRLLAVKELGGFYLDADLLLTRPLDPLRVHRCVFPLEWEMKAQERGKRFPGEASKGVESYMVGQYAFGAVAQHAFLQTVLTELVRRTDSFAEEYCSDWAILHSTGPDVYTTCYYREKPRWEKEVTLLQGEAGDEPGDVIRVPKDRWHRFGPYGRHLLNGGWRDGR
jgi:mannosyltransferase OCH1-like enzyme